MNQRMRLIDLGLNIQCTTFLRVVLLFGMSLQCGFCQEANLPNADTQLPDIVVGSMAPKLVVETWLKNAKSIGASDDVPFSFARDQVYLIEFWGTRCGPCIESVPKLQRLLEAHPKGLTIIAVSIREGEPDNDYTVETLQRVKDFVEKYLKDATFAIAYDGLKQEANRHWMLRGELDAIPTAFLIDQKGRIAYIGHPLSPVLEKRLADLMQGKFDIESAAVKYRSHLVEKRLMQKARELAQAGKLDSAIAVMENLVAMAPSWESAVSLEKFQMLMEGKHYDRAFVVAETIVNQPDVSGRMCEYIASRIGALALQDAQKGMGLALRSAKMAVEKNIEKYPVPPATLAEIYWKQGDREKAIEWQRHAVELADPEYKKNFQPQLEFYLQGSKTAGQ